MPSPGFAKSSQLCTWHHCYSLLKLKTYKSSLIPFSLVLICNIQTICKGCFSPTCIHDHPPPLKPHLLLPGLLPLLLISLHSDLVTSLFWIIWQLPTVLKIRPNHLKMSLKVLDDPLSTSLISFSVLLIHTFPAKSDFCQTENSNPPKKNSSTSGLWQLLFPLSGSCTSRSLHGWFLVLGSQLSCHLLTETFPDRPLTFYNIAPIILSVAVTHSLKWSCLSFVFPWLSPTGMSATWDQRPPLFWAPYLQHL